MLVLAVDGGLNAQTSETFVHNIERLVDTGLTKLVIDFRKPTYVSSYGMGMLVRLRSRIRKRSGQVKICGVPGVVAQLLDLTRLNKLFEIYPDVDRARLAFRQPTQIDS